jgi:hypothetical protein
VERGGCGDGDSSKRDKGEREGERQSARRERETESQRVCYGRAEPRHDVRAIRAPFLGRGIIEIIRRERERERDREAGQAALCFVVGLET